MDRKPWNNNGPRRSDRFNRFDNDRTGRSDRFEDRGDRRDRFDRSDRFERADRFDRSDRTERFGRSDRAGFGGRSFGERKSFGGRDGFRGPRRDFGDRRSQDFGVRSGPRARAFETRRFEERSDFAKNAVVKIDADIADFFESPAAVNKALRSLVEAARLVKFPVKAEQKAEAAEPVEPETAKQIFSDDDFDDDDDAVYGEGTLSEEAVEAADAAAEEDKAEKAEDAVAVPADKPEEK